jgi:hypothetical protein
MKFTFRCIWNSSSFYSFHLLPTCSQQVSRAFVISLDHTQTHTTVGRTPLDEGSARRRDSYLTTQTLYKTGIPAPGGIRTHDPSKRSATDPRLRPRGLNMKLQRLHYLFLVYLTTTVVSATLASTVWWLLSNNLENIQKWSWPFWGTILAYCGDWGKPRKRYLRYTVDSMLFLDKPSVAQLLKIYSFLRTSIFIFHQWARLLSHLNPILDLINNFFKADFNIILPWRLKYPKRTPQFRL